MTELRKPLDVLTEGRTLPEGCDSWAIKSVRADLRTRDDFRWPWPGNWAEAKWPFSDSDNPCPQHVGDGVCVAFTYAGMASGGYSARTMLLLAWHSSDLLAKDADKARVKRAFVVEVIDGDRFLANLSGCDLSRSNLSRSNLSWCDLSRSNLSWCDLSMANLSWCDLSRSNLSRSNLSRSNLSGCDLSRSNLSRSNLSWCDLSMANLSWCDLSMANLSRSNLSGQDLSSLRSRGAIGLPAE